MTSSSQPSAAPNALAEQDVIGQLAGVLAQSPLAELRAQRPEIAQYAQGSYQALLEPTDPGGVSRAERELLALRVAVLAAAPALVAWHRERLRALQLSDATIAAIEGFPAAEAAELTPREAALIRHTDRVTRAPALSTAADLAALSAVGLAPRDIVTVAQLIAFVSYQVRALAGLRLLEESR